jgi:hypothetical protein
MLFSSFSAVADTVGEYVPMYASASPNLMQNGVAASMNAKHHGTLQKAATSIMHAARGTKHAKMGRGVLPSPGRGVGPASLPCSPRNPSAMGDPASRTLVGVGA